MKILYVIFLTFFITNTAFSQSGDCKSFLSNNKQEIEIIEKHILTVQDGKEGKISNTLVTKENGYYVVKEIVGNLVITMDDDMVIESPTKELGSLRTARELLLKLTDKADGLCKEKLAEILRKIEGLNSQ